MRALLMPFLALSLAGCIAPQPRVVVVGTGVPAGGLPTAAQAGALSGQRQRVNFITALNPDCSAIGDRVTILSPPLHGSVEVVPGQGFPNFPAVNTRSKCNDRRVPGSLVYYISQAGYHGADSFRIRTLSDVGTLNTLPMNVTVE